MRATRLYQRLQLPLLTQFKKQICKPNYAQNIHLDSRSFVTSYRLKEQLPTTNTPPPPSSTTKEAKLSLTFKCKVCNVYNSNEISKVAYTQGVVLIQCTGCDNRHLIADNLNWFEDYKSNLDTIAKSNDEMVMKFDNREEMEEYMKQKGIGKKKEE